MSRPHLAYRPQWSPEIAGYAYNATRAYWPTLAPWYEWEDVTQESWVIFLLCQSRYTDTVTNPAWFMALFKTAWRNRLVDLAVAVPKYSLLEGLDYGVLQQAAPDSLFELLELVERLPFALRVALRDICRPKGRFRVTRNTIARLRLALS